MDALVKLLNASDGFSGRKPVQLAQVDVGNDFALSALPGPGTQPRGVEAELDLLLPFVPEGSVVAFFKEDADQEFFAFHAFGDFDCKRGGEVFQMAGAEGTAGSERPPDQENEGGEKEEGGDLHRDKVRAGRR